MAPARSDTGATPVDPAELEAGRLLFARECRFLAGAAIAAQLPADTLPEIAFAGRSNVGKSSLINALTGRNTLARTSNAPGRTRQVNFFELDHRLMLVDLPGYGYARASKGEIKRWNRLIHDYLRGRGSLRRVVLLIDARRGLRASDGEVMDRLDQAAVVYQAVLTKVDKAPAGELEAIREAVSRELARRPAAHPEVLATSTREGLGIGELRARLAALSLADPLGYKPGP